ncbi:MAG: lysostaphin resistance A-like protein, partial [Polyangiaceae bacterium]
MQPAPPAPRPALWPLLVAYLCAFLFARGASAAYIVVAALPEAKGGAVALADAAARFALTAPGLLGSALIDAVALLAVTLLAARLLRPRGATTRSLLRVGPGRITVAGTAAAVVGMTGLSLASGSVADLAGLGDKGVMASIAAALAGSSPGKIVLATLAIAVAPGVAEEAFFRGLFQTRLRTRLGRWPSIALTALAFGVFHVDPVQGSVAFVAGLFLGWIVERGGSTRTSMLAHAFNNAVFVLMASVASPGERS